MTTRRRISKADQVPIIVVPAHGDQPPVIRGPYGPTTESARRQCAANLRDIMVNDLPKYNTILANLKRSLGSRKKAIEWLKRAYPEAWTKETTDARQAGEQTQEG